jgi:hypothetical protein
MTLHTHSLKEDISTLTNDLSISKDLVTLNCKRQHRITVHPKKYQLKAHKDNIPSFAFHR